MKAISIKQPWAWAIFNGKPVENRVWHSDYRGPLLIHASKAFDKEGDLWIQKNKKILGIDGMPLFFPCGKVIGIVDMVSCVTYHPSPWFCGPYGFVFENPRLIDPFPMRGRLGIFALDTDEEQMARERISLTEGRSDG